MAIIILNLLANSRLSTLKRIFLLVHVRIPAQLLGAVRAFPDRSQRVQLSGVGRYIADYCSFRLWVRFREPGQNFLILLQLLQAQPLLRVPVWTNPGDLVLIGDDRLERRSGPSAHCGAP